MPSEPTTGERLAVLETWRKEHTAWHALEEERYRKSVDRRVIIIAAVITAIATIASGAIAGIVAYLVTTH
jgi:hypothetical protein